MNLSLNNVRHKAECCRAAGMFVTSGDELMEDNENANMFRVLPLNPVCVDHGELSCIVEPLGERGKIQQSRVTFELSA